MLRQAYIGDLAASGGIPLQSEAADYFRRMTTPPSPAFREAVNWAVFRWKAIGAWSQILGLWILSADTSQAALLSVIGDTPRDAVAVGTIPTFTALKGYSGFDATHGVKFPITSAIIASDTAYGFIAGRVLPDGVVSGLFMDCDDGVATLRPGLFSLVPDGSEGGVLGNGAGRELVATSNGNISSFVGGTKGFTLVTPSSAVPLGGGSNSRSSNYKTRALAASPLNRLCAYGFLATGASASVCRQFTSVLAEMLNGLGALD